MRYVPVSSCITGQCPPPVSAQVGRRLQRIAMHSLLNRLLLLLVLQLTGEMQQNDEVSLLLLKLDDLMMMMSDE